MIKRTSGLTLIEVILAMQAAAIVLTLLLTAYTYFLGQYQIHQQQERQLANERSFLHYIGRDISRSRGATVEYPYLYLSTVDGDTYRYSYDRIDLRVDKHIKRSGHSSYGGRITTGIGVTSISFEIADNDNGITIIYQILDSAEKTQFYRFQAKDG